MSWLEWTIDECENAPPSRDRIDRLRRLAAKGLDGCPLTDFTLDQLTDRLDEIRSQPRDERPRARQDAAGEYPAEHVNRYLVGVRKVALRDHGLDALAPAVHRLVGSTGYRLPAVASCGHPAPTGRVASSLAAFRTGVSWGAGATAIREMERRYRPPAPASERFSVKLH